ncbi:alpha/beta hydrolase [Anabaena sp. UHCC 0399]|uniref:alpha/beta hydrolase n=1 Tax=Anabaena sp. UHCC 0399 TaxID=3110238 RepID=UPI002B1FE14A|nr:alpha/beta hydrolase [Anabaena sp. UHCC 0399]MEA5564169.1 lysophospholipase [Anabaena sp. UHCC 0399]
MIYHNQSVFSGVGGLKLYYQSWFPEGKVKAVLVIVHGLGGHSDKYSHIVEHLVPKHYAIYSLDLRGHGRSPGRRGHINAWADFREDLRAFLQLIPTQQPQVPVFLLGHSLGAVIVLDYVLRYPQEGSTLQGVIALAPAIGKVGVSKFRLLVGRLMSKVWPSFTLNTGLDLAAASRDEKVLVAYTQDSLRHTRASARLATEYFATVAWIYDHAPEWQVPLLILHGGADRVALPEGGEIFYQLVNSPDKLRIEYPGAYHELQDDLNYQEVLTDLETWLEKHL